MHGTVPCHAILANPHIKLSGQSPICEAGREDFRHLLFTCSRAKKVWSALGLDMLVNEVCIVAREVQAILERLPFRQGGNSTVLGSNPMIEVSAIIFWYLLWERYI